MLIANTTTEVQGIMSVQMFVTPTRKREPMFVIPIDLDYFLSRIKLIRPSVCPFILVVREQIVFIT